VSSFQEVDAFS